MMHITEAMVKMYKSLFNLLPQQSIETLFGEVLRRFMKEFEDLYSKIPTDNRFSKKRIMIDLQYF
jgi:hypothetical protein